MLSKSQALEIILNHVPEISSIERVPFHAVSGRVLAEGVIAPLNLPPFDNSAVDGYAVQALDTMGASPDSPKRLSLIGEIRAGINPEDIVIKSGESVRIMTGAPLPRGADAAVMVERTKESDGQVEIMEEVAACGRVRFKGEDIRQGEVVLSAGHLLRAAEVGVLGAMGIAEVAVRRRPRVGVLSTGDEVVEIGRSLPQGKIYDSNRWMLLAMVEECGAEAIDLGAALDTMTALRDAIDRAQTERLDAVVTIGGVSAGRYDLVGTALAEQGFEKIFHKVAVKPGKPLLFAKHTGGMLAFGLPGNPVSAMITFHLFARPALLAMQSRPIAPPAIRATLAADLSASTDGRHNVVRVTLQERDGRRIATPLGKQGSHMLMSIVHAAGYVEVPPDPGHIPAGAEVDVVLF